MLQVFEITISNSALYTQWQTLKAQGIFFWVFKVLKLRVGYDAYSSRRLRVNLHHEGIFNVHQNLDMRALEPDFRSGWLMQGASVFKITSFSSIAMYGCWSKPLSGAEFSDKLN